MIESYLTHEMVIQGEPALDDYLRSTQVDFNDIKQESFTDLLKDLKDQNLRLKRLCTPLSLQSSVTKTAAFDGTISAQDYVERLRLVIKVTAITGNGIFTLQGSDDGGTTYYDVDLVDSNFATSDAVTITETGAHTFLLTNVYDKYRLQLVSIDTTITYSSYLIEDTYTTMHREKTRMKIYSSLMSTPNDVWDNKYKYYQDSYLSMLSNTKFVYDSDESSAIDEDEANANINQTITFRP